MSRRAPERPALWPVLLALLVSAVALGTLLWLRARLLQARELELHGAARLFAETAALRSPEEETVSFSQLEALARTVELGPSVDRIFVVKHTRRRDRPEVLLLPFAEDLRNPRWREETAAWRHLPVGDAGYLLLQPNTAALRAVNTASLASGLLVLGCLLALALRGLRKETALARTTFELEERKREVASLERLALTGRLATTLFHDLRKPVQTIRLEAEDALAGEGQPSVALQEIKTAADLFLAMLRETGIERFARPGDEEARPEYCDLDAIVDRSLALVRYERGAVQTHRKTALEAVPLVLAEPARLVQAVSNLILNAYQELNAAGRPDGGNLWLTVFSDDRGSALLLEDDGPGIPAHLRERIFEPFFTTRAHDGGTGLGLAICAMIARDLGGSLTLLTDHPPPNRPGARFLLTLPSPSSSP